MAPWNGPNQIVVHKQLSANVSWLIFENISKHGKLTQLVKKYTRITNEKNRKGLVGGPCWWEAWGRAPWAPSNPAMHDTLQNIFVIKKHKTCFFLQLWFN